MISIIDYFNTNGINYTVSGSEPDSSNEHPYKAFETGDECFNTRADDNFWIISFSQPVLIKSYFISGYTKWTWSITSWNVSYSTDGLSFKFIQTDWVYDLRGSKKIFDFHPPIYCQHMKIILNGTSDGDVALFFNSFNCFGSVGDLARKGRKRCTNNCAGAKRQLVTWVMITTLHSLFVS